MPRKPRFAPPGYYLHITQRGNYRQRTFFSDADHTRFLELLAQHADARQIDILAYCLMSNHFHLVARSAQPGGISRFLQGLAGQYAQQLHARLSRRGRFWQDRFYSCVLDRSHLATALRYVELNPVRARLVAKAEDYPWSSAAFHSGADGAPEWLDSTTFGDMYSPAEWRSRLAEGQSREERAAIRRATQWETALGDGDFLERLEAEYQVKLQAGPVGRPPKKPQGKQSFPEESMVVGGQGA